MKINLPTKITISRIALIVAMIIFWIVFSILCGCGIIDAGKLVLGDTGVNLVYLISCIVFVIAAFTDYLDGHLARKWNLVTDLGKFLDPIADKMLVNSTLIFIVLPWPFSTWQLASDANVAAAIAICVILMILRDLIVDTMRFMAATKGKVVAANIFGKLKTVLQMVAIPFCLLNGWPFTYFDSEWSIWRICMFLLYLATIASIVSGVIYVKQNAFLLKEDEQ